MTTTKVSDSISADDVARVFVGAAVSTQIVSRDGQITIVPEVIASIPVLTDEGMELQMLTDIMNAESLDDAAKENEGARKLGDFSGENVIIHAAGLRPSATENALGVYALIDLEVERTGRRYIVSCGGTKILGLLARAYRDDRLPWSCRALQTIPTEKGRSGQLLLVTREPQEDVF